MAAPAAPAAAQVNLTAEQTSVVHRVVHGRESIFLQGSAGSGKSATFHIIRSEAAKAQGCTVSATASTGIAGTHINGQTIHSFLGLGLGNESAEAIAAFIMGKFFMKATLANCRQTRILVIDEISMISAKLFELMDEVLRIVRGCPDRPMGGMQLLAMGDFSQLAPVIPDSDPDKRLAFESPVWQQLFPPSQCVRLTKIFRQKDELFIALLQNLRLGELSDESAETVKTVDRPLPALHGIEPTTLFCTRFEVDQFNVARLKGLPGVAEEHVARDQVFKENDGAPKTIDPVKMDKLFPKAPRVLTLKVGAQLMLMINFDPARGKVNGSRCVCTALHEDSSATVQFTDGATIRFVPHMFDAMNSRGKPIAARMQLPFNLAWACTIHKSQGMTLDYVSIDLSRGFAAGQVYTAVSRAKTLEGMEIKGGIPRGRLLADPRVLAFERGDPVPPSAAPAKKKNARKEPPVAAAPAQAKTSPHFPLPSAAAAAGVPTKKQRL